jgi:hypothetical protein
MPMIDISSPGTWPRFSSVGPYEEL